MKKRRTSAQQAEQRRIRLLSLLHKRPHTRKELLAIVEQEALVPIDHAQDLKIRSKRQNYLFHSDIETLRKEGWHIQFDQSSQCYSWHNSPFALFLKSEHVAAFTVLIDTFAGMTVPHTDEIRSLLSTLLTQLAPEQQHAIQSQRRTFGILIQETTDYQKCDPVTVENIEKAIRLQQQLEFQYLSSDGVQRRHVIEPSPLVLKDGHVYFDGWSLEYTKTLLFRLDRVIAGTAHILSTKKVQGRPKPRTYELRYQLTAHLARKKVSEHFPDQQPPKWLEDGSALVTASITNLFEAQRILLSYGEHCTVLSPPKLVEMMRSVAEHYHNIYLTPEASDEFV